MDIKQNVFQRMEKEYMFGIIQRFLKSVNPLTFNLTKVYPLTLRNFTKFRTFKLPNMKEKQQLK